MRNTAARSRDYWLKIMGGLLALFLWNGAGSALAVLSGNTGQIHGSAPTVTGELSVLIPSSGAPVINNDVVPLKDRPDEFTVSSQLSNLEMNDQDGDTGLNAWVDLSEATLLWKRSNGIPLTAEELAAPLGNFFSAESLTIEVRANVTASSTTGQPLTAGPQPFTASYQVNVPDSAELTVENLTVTVDYAMANGAATNEVQAKVTGFTGTPLEGQTVSFVADNEAEITTVIGTTGADGIAKATLTSMSVGTSNVTATVNGSSQSVTTTFVAPYALTGVLVNEKTFGVTEGFPSTGFTGATFTLAVSDEPDHYTWDNGGSTWVSVDNNGTVTFTATGNSAPVTITATPKAGGVPLAYTFSVNTWFINNGTTTMNWSNASTWCLNQGLVQPTRTALSQGNNLRGIGALRSEWGNMGVAYGSSGFSSNNYWTSDNSGGAYYYIANLGSGDREFGAHSAVSYSVVCQQKF
ncbi:Ig-like domain-containing protein [Chania multitudinisentens]|uniref:Ig-like domain-containing protein n=1 Tax=Chania multitudinisentens TaxID=1639108 RepID=UPI0004BB9ABF|nr:Ig-like domain-containing protein [Chania multitudinisentens]